MIIHITDGDTRMAKKLIRPRGNRITIKTQAFPAYDGLRFFIPI
jgi:hypothetical protein